MSSEQDINLYELLNLSIRPPQRSEVDFFKLHDLLRAMLTQLQQLEENTRCSGERQDQDGTSEVERAVSTPTLIPSSDAGADGQWGLQAGAGTLQDLTTAEDSDLMDPVTLEIPSPSSSSVPQQQCPPETAETMSNLMVKLNKLEAEVEALSSDIRTSVQRLEQDMKQLKATQAEGSKNYDHLQDQNADLVNSLQRAVLQLQADCEKLQETTRCLHEDNLLQQSRLETLRKKTEELEEKKADKMMVERTLKTDKSSLVSQLQFDSVTEELFGLFNELLGKVAGQEEDIRKLSTEMECKVSRIEFESVKKALEDRKVLKKLPTLEAREANDAAASRKSLCELQFETTPQEKIQPKNKGKPCPRVYSYLPMVRHCKDPIITRTMMFRNLKKMRDARAHAWRNPPVQTKPGALRTSSPLLH